MKNTKKEVREYEFNVVLELHKDKQYFAYVPSIDGCFSSGVTIEDAMKNIKEAIKLHLSYLKEKREKIISSRHIFMSPVSVKV